MLKKARYQDHNIYTNKTHLPVFKYTPYSDTTNVMLVTITMGILAWAAWSHSLYSSSSYPKYSRTFLMNSSFSAFVRGQEGHSGKVEEGGLDCSGDGRLPIRWGALKGPEDIRTAAV